MWSTNTVVYFAGLLWSQQRYIVESSWNTVGAWQVLVPFPETSPLHLSLPYFSCMGQEGEKSVRIDSSKRAGSLVIRMGKTELWFSNVNPKAQVQDHILPLLSCGDQDKSQGFFEPHFSHLANGSWCSSKPKKKMHTNALRKHLKY